MRYLSDNIPGRDPRNISGEMADVSVESVGQLVAGMWRRESTQVVMKVIITHYTTTVTQCNTPHNSQLRPVAAIGAGASRSVRD